MSSNYGQRKPSGSGSKHVRLLPTPDKTSRPSLQVDTSFSRHKGQTPQPVPVSAPKSQQQQQVLQQPHFISLHDLKVPSSKQASSNVKSRRGLKEMWENRRKGSREQQSTSAHGSVQQPGSLHSGHALIDGPPPAYSASTTSAPMPRRLNRLRPSPLNLSNEVSPSDRAIPIGIAIDTDNIQTIGQSPQSGPHRQDSHKYGQQASTPTIVITPAKEDFESNYSASPEDMKRVAGYRASSVYSRYTNGLPNPRHERTPPVPPLPLFAVENASSLRDVNVRESMMTEFEDEDEPAPPYEETPRNRTMFEEGIITPASAPIRDSRRLTSQSHLPTPRRSKGWWNVLTSPFSAASGARSFFRSSSLPEQGEPGMQSLTPGGSIRGLETLRTELAFTERSIDDCDLHSAPLTHCTGQSLRSGIRTPARSDTAPGALDMGNSDDVNIYQQAGQGAASSYYDPEQDFLNKADLVTPNNLDRDLPPEGWSPSQSVYREPQGDGFDFSQTPKTGEAASYYDPNRRFSTIDEGRRTGDGDLQGWSPSYSVYRGSHAPATPSTGFGAGAMVESPMEFDGRGSNGRTTPHISTPGMDRKSGGDTTDTFTPSGFRGEGDRYQNQYGTVTPTDKGPLAGNDSKDSGGNMTPMILDAHKGHGQGDYGDDQARDGITPRTSISRSTFDDGGNFADFSATYPVTESGSPTTPSKYPREFVTPALPGTAHGFPRDSIESHLSPTPVLENARTATFVRPPPSEVELREVDRSRAQTPDHYRAGLGGGTMASRQADIDVDSMQSDDEKPPYPPPSTSHSRNNSQGLGISDDGSKRALFPQERQPYEKPSFTTDASEKDARYYKEDDGPKRPWYLRFLWLFVVIAVVLFVTGTVLLFVLLPLHHDNMPVEAQWLKLTEFPPMPTGVSTVIGANTVEEVSGCVSPESLWSCSAPPNEALSSPNGSPNFRFLIRSKDNNGIETSSSKLRRRTTGQPAQAGAVVRRGLWINYLYSPTPAPPPQDDQVFLGRTTDHVSEPYNGQETPFYISLLNATSLGPTTTARMRKRDGDFTYPYPVPSQSSSVNSGNSSDSGDSDESDDDSSDHNDFRYPYPKPSQGESVGGGGSKDSNSSDTSHSGAVGVPSADIKSNGEPEAAKLYSFPYAQPLRLFNRGRPDEHYGFYTYFDRSIYVSNMILDSSSSNATLGGDVSNNVPLDEASAVCIWSQTRLHVQIWTAKPQVTSLDTVEGAGDIKVVDSTANDMAAPGSFPYAVTITIDRHGGTASEKGLYCYGLDDQHQVVKDSATWVTEDRAFNGKLVNPAVVPGSNETNLQERDSELSTGIDGGNGGCSCQWQNWR